MGRAFKSGAQSQAFPKYQNQALSNTPLLVSKDETNLYAFFLENNANAAVYLHLFDADNAGAVNPGTTDPDEVIKVSAAGQIIWDAIQVFHHFNNGIVAMVTSTRAKNAAAPAGPLAVRFYMGKN